MGYRVLETVAHLKFINICFYILFKSSTEKGKCFPYIFIRILIMPQNAGIKHTDNNLTSVPSNTVFVHSKHYFNLTTRHSMSAERNTQSDLPLSLAYQSLRILVGFSFLNSYKLCTYFKAFDSVYAGNHFSNLFVCTFKFNFLYIKKKLFKWGRMIIKLSIWLRIEQLLGSIISGFYFLLLSNFFLQCICIT